MDKVLIDTDIFSEILKSRDKAVAGRARAYRDRHDRFTISVSTAMEIISGLSRLEAHKQLESFLSSINEVETLPIDQGIAVLAGRIDGALTKKGVRIGINDVLIGATAIQFGLVLVTGNFKHYSRIRSLGYPLGLDNWRD